MTIKSEAWIVVWLDPLRNAINLRLLAKAAHSTRRDLLGRLLDQTKYALDEGTPGRKAFQAPLLII